MRIADFAPEDRPRERLHRLGPEALADAELVALFLGTGTRGRSALELAAVLLARYDGVGGLLRARASELADAPGMGPAKAALVAAAAELGRRALACSLRRAPALSQPRDCAAYLRAWLKDRPQEVFACVFLDSRHRVIATEALFHGTIDGASVHPREIVRRALALNAAALILAHNHPSGVAEPSAADIAITRRVADALALVDVRVLDHFVVGEGEPVSLAERGLL